MGKKLNIIDENIKGNWSHYVLQCIMAMIATGFIVYVIDSMFQTVIMAAYGATTFIVFAMPKTKNSSPRRVIGGYIVAAVIGVAFFQCSSMIINEEAGWAHTIVAAMTTGVVLFVMTITNTEHPPAAGMAFGIALQGYSLITLAVIILAVIVLILVKWLLKDWLINLL